MTEERPKESCVTPLGKRQHTRRVMVGEVALGGCAPISVQSMTKTDTREAAATLAQIEALSEAGCDIARVAVPDAEAARALGEICAASPLPVVADIHFNYRLALAAVEVGVAKIRLNPGNLRRAEEVKEVAQACRGRNIPIRIGVNAGSVSQEVRERFDHIDDHVEAVARAMVESAFEHIRLLEDEDFSDIVVSLKAFDVPATLLANRLFAQKSDYPIHLGITEAGRPPAGLVRSCVGMGILLAEGIGDTIRVSLTADSTEEVRAGREILASLGLRKSGIIIVSCPTCGRCRTDIAGLVERAEELLTPLDSMLMAKGRSLHVAIMGCEVNGPGEAREADVGLAAGKEKAAIFSRGELVCTLPTEEAFAALLQVASKMVDL